MGGYHQFDSLPIFYAVKKFAQILFISIQLLISVSASKADVGLTHELKVQRSEILQRIAKLENDSISNQTLIDSLQKAVINIDTQIMNSYDETVARLAAQKRQRGNGSRTVVYISLLTTFIALFVLVLLAIARRKLFQNQGVGLLRMYRDLTSEFVHSVSAEKAESKGVLRVNVVVVAGLILMSVSIIAFLIRTL